MVRDSKETRVRGKIDLRQRRAAILVVHSAAIICCVSIDGDVRQRRAALIIVYPTAFVLWIGAIGIAICDGEAIQHCRAVCSTSGDYVIGVIGFLILNSNISA